MESPTEERTDQVGRYLIIDHLATGGMAAVFLAIEKGTHGLQRPVVIKRILPRFDSDENHRMLLQEARLAARVNHPNVVEIFEMGTDGQRPFIAMEYVAGVQLRELVSAASESDETLPIGVALCLIMQACAGAQAAHDLKGPTGEPENLVHRDLSPQNLMVTDHGHVKVLDFGIAKAAFNPDKTATGVLKGKYTYLSPEQVREEELDRRSDVFTLGTVLWELLTGEVLFRRNNEFACMNAVLNEPIPDIRTRRAEIPEAVADVVSKALVRDVHARFQTAEAFRRALAAAATKAGINVSTDAAMETVSHLMGTVITNRKKWVEGRIAKAVRQVGAEEPDGPSPFSGGQRTTALRDAYAQLDQDTLVEKATSETKAELIDTMIMKPARVPSEQAPPSKGPIRWMAAAALCSSVAVWIFAGMKSEPARPTGEPLVIAVPPVVDAMRVKEDMDPVRTYLERTLDRPVDWRVPESYRETSELLLAEEVPFAILPPLLYVRTKAKNDAVEPLAVKEHSGTSGYDGVLIARTDAKIGSPADLAGKRICYTNEDSTTGYHFPRQYIREAGLDPDSLFSDVRFSGNHTSVLRDIGQNLCDVGGTANQIYHRADEMQVSLEGTQVLWVTGRAPHDAVTAGPSATRAEITALREALLNFDPQRDAGVHRVGNVERLSGFDAIADSVYDPLREALPTESTAPSVETE